ncbi:MAG TPA: hypothetical protein VFI61_04450 [Patescibacteria group bacterium]|nr:hypothetical protein [Patescibacteria group bacterium]
MQKLSSPIDLIKKSFEIFFKKGNLVYFLKVYSPLVPFWLFGLFQKSFMPQDSINDPASFVSKYPWLVAFVVISNLLLVIISFWVGAAGILAIEGVLTNKVLPVKELFKVAWKKLWGFSLVSILTLLAIFGGIILLVIPGIIFSVWFYFSKFIFMEGKTGIVDSLKKSKALIKGRFWKIFGRVFVFGIFTALAGAIVSAVPYIGTLTVSLVGALGILPSYLLYRELSE